MINSIRIIAVILILLSASEYCQSAETVRRQRSLFGLRTEVGSYGLTFGKTHSSMYAIGLSFDYLSNSRSSVGGNLSYIKLSDAVGNDFTMSAGGVELAAYAKYFPINTLRDSSIAPYICGGTSLIIGSQDVTSPAVGTIGQQSTSNIMFFQTLTPSLGVMIPIGKRWFLDFQAKFTLGYGIARETVDTGAGKELNGDMSYSLFTQVSGIGGISIFF